MEFDNLLFLLVGYKGKKRVKWIREKLGTAKDDIIRIAVPIKLNESKCIFLYNLFVTKCFIHILC